MDTQTLFRGKTTYIHTHTHGDGGKLHVESQLTLGRLTEATACTGCHFAPNGHSGHHPTSVFVKVGYVSCPRTVYLNRQPWG